jgi:uncharacterized protein
MNSNALIVFIKNPELGKVKTRLAADVGDAGALEIYYQLLDHTRKVALGCQTTNYLYYASYIDHEDEWSSRKFHKRLQGGYSLGQRMKSALDEVLQHHNKAILIGSDCPGITCELIQVGFDMLRHNDVVLGPSMDGGYYLIGMNQLHSDLFKKIPWSTEQVLPITRAKIKELDLQWDELPVLSDIDTISDWERWGKQ